MRSCLPFVLALMLVACESVPPAPTVNPAALAPHEWDHGPPWGLEEIPWIPPPPVAAPYWGFGGGVWVGRGSWWRGPYAHRGGGYWGHRGRPMGGRRGRR